MFERNYYGIKYKTNGLVNSSVSLRSNKRPYDYYPKHYNIKKNEKYYMITMCKNYETKYGTLYTN